MHHLTYESTVRSCFVAYIVQAIVINFAPLLFVTFQQAFSIGLEEITFLIAFTFAIQLVIDLASAYFIDRIGYRRCMVAAHVFAAAGLLLLSWLPFALEDPFMALLISVATYAIGGGLLEVLVSPVVEACPTKNKEKEMSLLHSFYCWGFVAVILISTGFFSVFGVESWPVMARLWAIVPLANMVAFIFVPIYEILPGERKSGMKELLSNGIFWLLFLMMIASGATEQAVGQWASAFAETGLRVSKTIGDLTGPCLFAFMQGLARLIFGRYGDRIDLRRMMLLSAILCCMSYLLTSLSSDPVLGLVGCALCGLSVGIFWPGTFSIASSLLRRGGTSMFAFLALAGDVGCSTGPALTGLAAAAFGGRISSGILCAMVFPIFMLIALLVISRIRWIDRNQLLMQGNKAVAFRSGKQDPDRNSKESHDLRLYFKK